ncbi:hypothetical protein CZP2022_209 [Vibrio phage C-ZP2022]|nr:hypothetical protein CZP2022_209 [Vibrio phage C-ZP2022]
MGWQASLMVVESTDSIIPRMMISDISIISWFAVPKKAEAFSIRITTVLLIFIQTSPSLYQDQ